MIKAPFRFDIEYFSIVVILRGSIQDESQHFVSQNQQEASIAKNSKNELMSLKGHKIRESCNLYNRKVPKQLLYFIVQNKRTLQIYGSTNTTQALEMQTKTIFPDVAHLYSYLRNHCNSDLVKMTKRGNLIVDYFINQTIYQLKIDNQPFLIPSRDIEDIWKELKSSWDNRKQSEFDQCQKYLRCVKRGNFMLNTKMQQINKDEQYQNQDSQADYPKFKSLLQRSSRQLQNIKTPDPCPKRAKKYEKIMRKKHEYQAEYSSSQSAEVESERQAKTNKYLNYRYQDQSPTYARPTPKQYVRQRKLSKKRKHERENLKTMHQPQSLLESKSKAHTHQTLSLQSGTRIEQSLRRIQFSLDSLQKHYGEHLVDRINEYVTYKLDQLIHTVTQHFSKHSSNLNKLSQQLQQNLPNSNISISTDQVIQKAYSLFCKEKEQIFSREFQLPAVSTKENLQRIWQQLGTDGREVYILKAQKRLTTKKNAQITNQENINKKITKAEKRINLNEKSEEANSQDQGLQEQSDFVQK